MKAANILVLAFSANAVAYDAQKVLGSADLLGTQKYECKNGAKPSIVCDDTSKKHNCSCTCTNGITFEQPLDPFASPGSGVVDETCKTEKMECIEREQALELEKTELEKEKQGLATDVLTLNEQLVAYWNKPNYTYVGCTTDSSKRVLVKFQKRADMTAKLCDSLCKEYKFFGTQFGEECWCDETFKQPTQHVAEKECNMACTGNKTEKCGGSVRNSLYMRTA